MNDTTTDSQGVPARANVDTTSSAQSASADAAAPTDAELLRALWRETLKALLQELRSGDAKASAIAVARAFLDSNSVSLESLDKLDHKGPGAAAAALGPMLARLPSFED